MWRGKRGEEEEEREKERDREKDSLQSLRTRKLALLKALEFIPSTFCISKQVQGSPWDSM